MHALRIHAGPLAREHVRRHGLQPPHVGIVPGAAGGPKGLILGPLDRFLFGHWLPQSSHEIHLVGASIGAWRMATACLNDPTASFHQLERDYIAQRYELAPGEQRPSAERVSREFGQNLANFYGGRVPEVLRHKRYRLHVVTTRGKHVLAREGRWRTPAGYAGAFFSNVVARPAMGRWLERVVFSSQLTELPFGVQDYRTRQVGLVEGNFMQAVQASCSIPFVLQAVHDIPQAPKGAYWDGGITDYHLHLDYRPPSRSPIVLYPHFQKTVVPGWLDKNLKWRHRATAKLDSMLLLAPNPDWVRTLPNAKLPDRQDFVRYGPDLAARTGAWNAAVSASQQLADEFAAWLERPDLTQVHDL